MKIFLQTFTLWLSTCPGFLSAEPRLYLSAQLGSSIVLPCDWRNMSSTLSSTQNPHVEWRTMSETVFERRGDKHYQGEQYEGRVDVHKDQLLSGDCSLTLKNVKLDDEGPYESYLLDRRKERGLTSKWVFIQSIELSVYEPPDIFMVAAQETKESNEMAEVRALSNAQGARLSQEITAFLLLTNIFFHIF